VAKRILKPDDLIARSRDGIRDVVTAPDPVDQAEMLDHQQDDESRIKDAFTFYGQPVPQHDEIFIRGNRYCVGLDPSLNGILDPVTLYDIINMDRMRAFSFLKTLVKLDFASGDYWVDATRSGEPFWAFSVFRDESVRAAEELAEMVRRQAEPDDEVEEST